MGLHRLGALGVDDHAVGHLRVAGDLELGHLLDLDQAHAAVAVHGQVAVPAEVGDLDPRVGRGLDDRGPGGHLELPAVDRELGHYRSSSPAITFSPPMVATASASIAAADHVREGLVDVEAGGAHLDPPGALAPVAHDVVAELPVGPLRVAVDLALGRQDALVDQLEVVHEGFDVRVDLGLGRYGHALVVGDDRALGQLRQRLLDDPQALAHLLHAHEVAVVAVAHRPHGDVEVVLLVAGVGMVLAHVVGDPGAAQARADPAPVERVLPAHDADALEAVHEDHVPGQELVREVPVLLRRWR